MRTSRFAEAKRTSTLLNLDVRIVRTASAALGAALLLVGSASAQTVVTACGRDDAVGGTNLLTALAGGGSIVIRCGAAAATIEITRTHALSTDTAIDGEGRVTLTGNGSRPMFTTPSTVTLTGLTIRNSRPGGVADTRSPTTAVVVGRRVELTRVRTEDTIGPYVVTDFSATDSVFENNGDAAAQSYRAVIEAQTITLRRATFNRNADHPIGGGTNSATPTSAATRSILIEDSTFTENRFPILILDGALTVRRTTFAKNGAASAAGDRDWGCCAGAIMLTHSVADIEDSQFVDNASSGFGGAIAAIGSRLVIRRTLFERNSARVGGALLSWGRPAATNFWSTGPIPSGPTLSLDRVRFKANTASEIGGAVAWSGQKEGDSGLFAANRARRGGAVAHISAGGGLSGEFADVFAAVGALTTAGPETLALARGIFADNIAVEQGSAIDGGDATVSLGNALATRNRVEASSANATTLYGAELTLANATIVGNANRGVAIAGPGGTLRLLNSIVANNGDANCSANGGSLFSAATIQYPDTSCNAVAVAPELDGSFVPSLSSPARYAGDVSGCLGEALVMGVDLHGASRARNGKCAIGAIEPDADQQLFANTPFARSAQPWLWVLILFWVFLAVGLIVAYKHARRRRRTYAQHRPATA